MYSKIKDFQKKGFSIRSTARNLGISRVTVKKYYSMPLEEYRELAEGIRKLGCLEKYEPVVLDWIYEYPDMTAAQVYDWLLENYQIDVSERTVGRFVNRLRADHSLPKQAYKRDYEACDERPMGHQMQLDFGVQSMPLPNRKGHKKVYFAGFVLAHSRYKFGYFLDHPFTSADLVMVMQACFAYFGGVTNEIVVDQDSIITVEENHGDIVYTYEFEKFKQQHDLNIRVCRKADPESKGMIENMVKFVKRNFLVHRQYMEPDLLNECFLAWLERTGNAKIHGTTKKVPAKVFEFEREHLRPILIPENYFCKSSIIRSVRKDNTIVYKSNRYSLPLGTYNKDPEVSIKEVDGKLQIWQGFGDYLIVEHPVSLERGKLIKNSDHKRNKEDTLDKFQEKALAVIGQSYEAYLLSVRASKPRYYRDQLTLLEECLTHYALETVQEAITYCDKLSLYSFNDVKDACRFMGVLSQSKSLEIFETAKLEPIHKPGVMDIVTQKRDIGAYALVGGGSAE